MRHLSSVFLLCLLGCSGGADGPALYPVTGTLKAGGKPLADITVQLIPVDANSKTKPGTGVTDAEGNFTIRTNGDKGAETGKFKVVLAAPAASVPSGPMSLEEATKMSGQYAKSGGPPKVAPSSLPFPAEWAGASTTPKEIDVAKEPVVINIDI